MSPAGTVEHIEVVKCLCLGETCRRCGERWHLHLLPVMQRPVTCPACGEPFAEPMNPLDKHENEEVANG